MARVFASMTGREALPDLLPLWADNATDGELAGLIEPANLVARWDPLDGERHQDFDDVGVDGGGVWVARHPDLIIAEMPRASEIVDAWLLGDTELSREDIDELDGAQLYLKRTMVAAARRAEQRKIEQPGATKK